MEDDIQQQLQRQNYGVAFDLLVERFKEKVFRLSFSMLRNETQAEDAAQEVFIRVWKALANYQGDASLSTWIYTITRNVCLTELKRRNARPTVSLQSPEMEGAMDFVPELRTSDPESGVEMDVQTILEQLSEKYRRVIVLFYLEQKQYEEVASMLSIPLGTVKTLLFRAKKEFVRLAARKPAQGLRVEPAELESAGAKVGSRSVVSGPKPILRTLTQM